MLNLVQKFFKNDRSDKAKIRADFAAYFFSLPEHAWLADRKLQQHFEHLFGLLPIGLIEALVTSVPVVFVLSHTLKQRSAGTSLSNTIVVFPEFHKLLLTDARAAVAYLAHEIAFILYELEAPGQDPMLAEVEADKFVCDIGLADALEDLLLMLDETIEKRLRLTYLTINHFTKN